MARAGEVLENPVSGERITFIETSTDTGGERLVWEHWIGPGGHVGRDHIHPAQRERFEVLEGEVRVRMAREHQTLSVGPVLEVPPGLPHGLSNQAVNAVRMRIELWPALTTERFFEEVFGLAAAGKVNSRGVPRALKGAAILARCPDTVYLPGLPIVLQKAGIAVLSGVARVLRL